MRRERPQKRAEKTHPKPRKAKDIPKKRLKARGRKIRYWPSNFKAFEKQAKNRASEGAKRQKALQISVKKRDETQSARKNAKKTLKKHDETQSARKNAPKRRRPEAPRKNAEDQKEKAPKSTEGKKQRKRRQEHPSKNAKRLKTPPIA